MKKLSAVIPADKTDEVLRALQRLGCAGVEKLDTPAPPAEDPSPPELSAAVEDAVGEADAKGDDAAADGEGKAVAKKNDAPPEDEILPDFVLPDSIAEAAKLDEYDASAEIAAAEEKRSAITAAIEFLDEYHTGKNPLFHNPEELTPEEFEENRLEGAEEVLRKARSIYDELTSSRRRVNELSALTDQLAPFESVDLPLPRSSTEYTETVCGSLSPSSDLKALDAALAEHACVFEIVYETKLTRAAVLTAYRDDFEDCLAVAAAHGFVAATVTANAKEGCANGRAKKARAELESKQKTVEDMEKEAEELANESLGELKTYLDYVEITLMRLEAKRDLRVTEKCAVIGAYVPTKAAEKVTAMLDEKGAAWDLSDADSSRENVPILLDNNKLGSKFEGIVGMYSFPKYDEFDPSFIMSFFYIAIFGLMFADVGYGVVLTLGCLAGLKLMHPKGNLKRFLGMFAICGISSMICGALFGGYFGDMPARFMTSFLGIPEGRVPGLALAFDMMKDPITFLVVSLAMGALHLLCGMAVKFYILWREKRRFEAIFDVGSWFFVFIGIGVYFLNDKAGLIVAGVGVLMLVCTQGRAAKNPIMKLAKGVMSLYDLIGYASDLLSYSRILALSLASAVIASVVNIFATMNGLTVGGIIMFIVVGIIGHLLNFAVNILGTYVHTSRLQYIEFFGKFYEGGGREFAPLNADTKYVTFK